MKTNAMVLTQIQLFQLLKEKLGESQAESLVTFVDNSVTQEFESHKELFATKEDIAQMEGRLSVQIAKSRTEQIIWTIASFAVLFIAAVSYLKYIK